MSEVPAPTIATQSARVGGATVSKNAVADSGS